MNDISTLLPADIAVGQAAATRGRSYRQAWLDALEDASMSRSPRWRMPAHAATGDGRAAHDDTRQAPAATGVPVGKSAAPSDTAVSTVSGGQASVGAVPVVAPSAQAPTSPRVAAVLHTLADLRGLPAHWAGPLSSDAAAPPGQPNASLWPRQRFTVLASARGGIEIWVRDASLVGTSRLAGLLQDLLRTFGNTATSLVKVAVNGKVIYQQDAAIRARRPLAEVAHDGS